MTTQEMWRCERCGKVTMHKAVKVNHVFHAIMSLLTCGVWLLVWAGSCISFGKTHTCLECGAKN